MLAGSSCGWDWGFIPGRCSAAGWNLISPGGEPLSTASLADKLQLIIIQVPLSNFYESLIFFSWCLPALGLLAFRRSLKGYLGAMVALLSTLLLAYASFRGGQPDQTPDAGPEEQLAAHPRGDRLPGLRRLCPGLRDRHPLPVPGTAAPPIPTPLPLLDSLIYRTTVLGFLLLTLGIATGAVWAETAWGRYWSWDPKETWSLITWFIYAALLHARLLKGWHGRRIAWLAVLGFMAVLFTYFGVSFLLNRPALLPHLKKPGLRTEKFSTPDEVKRWLWGTA